MLSPTRTEKHKNCICMNESLFLLFVRCISRVGNSLPLSRTKLNNSALCITRQLQCPNKLCCLWKSRMSDKCVPNWAQLADRCLCLRIYCSFLVSLLQRAGCVACATAVVEADFVMFKISHSDKTCW